jgi:RNA polymerase sigma factor (sigma-70 family)
MLGAEELLDVFVGYQARLKRLLAGRLKSPHAAEDLAQDLYFKLSRLPGHFPGPDDARRYLTRMAINAAMDHQRVEGRRAELLEGLAGAWDDGTPSPEQKLIARSEVEQLEQVLKDLPPKCRDVLYMSRVEGMTHAEIAAALGVSKSLVDKYAVRALLHCRARLKQQAEAAAGPGSIAAAAPDTR